ncbi:MAG: hypothetical protein KA205_09595 [Acidobacteria bacterium]|nr:hypothetical protein [Acidobacteriota bacterium]
MVIPPVALVVGDTAGGSRGAAFFSDRLPDVIEQLVSNGIEVEVRQQAPSPDALRARYASMGINATADAFRADIAGACAQLIRWPA